MAEIPPAPARGAIRERLLEHVDWLLEEPTTLGDRETSADIRDFIAAYDAQAARLAAVEQLIADVQRVSAEGDAGYIQVPWHRLYALYAWMDTAAATAGAAGEGQDG